MNSDDEDLKEKVKFGEVTINKAYEEVRKKETRICKMCGNHGNQYTVPSEKVFNIANEPFQSD